MINTRVTVPDERGLSLLLLGAHCDDIEMGCGGTLLKWTDEYRINNITWIVFTSNEIRKDEAIASANEFLHAVPKADINVFDYKDGYLPASWSKVKDEFENIKEYTEPDIIFTHYRNDL